MKYYPINLDIKNKNCLVVGGGDVGERKVLTLLKCNAKVTVISKTFTKKLQEISADNTHLTIINREYETSDLKNSFLVIVATNDEKLNNQISTQANENNILCNVVDKPEVCNFILPSIVAKDDLVIAISTSGTSPALAKKIRLDLEKQFGDEYSQFLKLMSILRKEVICNITCSNKRKKLFEKLVNSNLIDLLKKQDYVAVNLKINEILSPDFVFEFEIKK